MQIKKLTQVALVAMLLMAGLPLAQADTPITYPSAVFTVVNGMNDVGQTVGWHDTNLAFIRSGGGVFTDIAYPSSTQNVAMGINHGGDACGYYFVSGTTWHGWIRSAAGSFTDVNYPGATSTWPQGIDDSDDVVGLFDPPDSMGRTAFERTAGGTYTALSGPGSGALIDPLKINNSGQIAGYSYTPPSQVFHGFLRSSGGAFTTIDYPGAVSTSIDGLDNSGGTVGFYFTGTQCAGPGQTHCTNFHGFTRTSGGTLAVSDHCGSNTGDSASSALVIVGLSGTDGAGNISGYCAPVNSQFEGFTSP